MTTREIILTENTLWKGYQYIKRLAPTDSLINWGYGSIYLNEYRYSLKVSIYMSYRKMYISIIVKYGIDDNPLKSPKQLCMSWNWQLRGEIVKREMSLL